MGKAWDVLITVFILVAVFLVVYYWVGVKEITGAFFSGLTNLVSQLQGAQPFGRSLPTGYPGSK